MKRIIIASLLSVALVGAASADPHYYHENHYHYHSGWGWGPGIIAGIITGAVVGDVIEAQRTPPPVVVVPQPVYPVQPYLQQPPVGYHWEQLFDPGINRYKYVLVPN